MSIPEQLSDLTRRLEKAEQELRAWRNLAVATESGGGSVVVGTDAVILKINSLTSASAQLP